MSHETEKRKRKQWEDLKRLQEVDFVLVELNLYLDTHPQDESARQQFNYYVEQRKRIQREYEEKYGPLMNFGHSKFPSNKRWIDGPWPWEL